MRRLNLEVAFAACRSKEGGWTGDLAVPPQCPIGQGAGVLIVDATRRGKRFPDALSRTVPIWCAVINQAVARHKRAADWDLGLHMPHTIPPQEIALIQRHLDGWAEQVAALPAVAELAREMERPLRPLWMCPDDPVVINAEDGNTDQLQFLPVICVSASRAVPEGTQSRLKELSFVYVQGAGDDEENWAGGLAPTMHWKELLKLGDTPELQEAMKAMRVDAAAEPSGFTRISGTRLTVGDADTSEFDAVISLGTDDGIQGNTLCLAVPDAKGKNLAKRGLEPLLGPTLAFTATHPGRVLIRGHWLSICLAIAVIVNESCEPPTKQLIQQTIVHVCSERATPLPRGVIIQLNRHFLSECYFE